MKTLVSTFAFVNFILFAFNSSACSPCGALSNISSTINGTNLELNFTSNAGWDCCYTVDIEIICESETFTGIPNYTSAEICLNGGNGASTTNTLVTPYPTLIIDISGWCPGVYRWRGIEPACGFYTPVQTFTIVGPSPIIIATTVAEDTVCLNESTQITAAASNGCSSEIYTYSWSPSAGLSNANIANPIATPLTTTTYTLTVTETGACSAPPQTTDVTITI